MQQLLRRGVKFLWMRTRTNNESEPIFHIDPTPWRTQRARKSGQDSIERVSSWKKESLLERRRSYETGRLERGMSVRQRGMGVLDGMSVSANEKTDNVITNNVIIFTQRDAIVVLFSVRVVKGMTTKKDSTRYHIESIIELYNKNVNVFLKIVYALCSVHYGETKTKRSHPTVPLFRRRREQNDAIQY